MKSIRMMFAATTALCAASAVHATDLEVTHWWTSGGEAAAAQGLEVREHDGVERNHHQHDGGRVARHQRGEHGRQGLA